VPARFPDSARTWRYLLPQLADAGFHAVAPFMRGYAPTAIPADGRYGLGALVADAVGLHDAAGPYAAQEQALARCGPQPTLYLHGSRDGCIDVALVQDAELHLTPGSRVEVVADAGHFLQVEKPAAVNDRILSWVSA
jgi:pimeloyl-ACP methyl ester carboxylesterase